MTQTPTPPSPKTLEQIRTGFEAGTVVYTTPRGTKSGVRLKKYPSSSCYLVEYSVFQDPNKQPHQWEAIVIIDGQDVASEYLDGTAGEVAPSDLATIFADLESLAKTAS